MKRLLFFVLISVTTCKKQYEDLFSSNRVEIPSIVAGKSLTLKNNTSNLVSMEGWKLTYEYDYITTSTTTYTIRNTALVSGEDIIYTAAELNFEPGIISSHIYLYDKDGNLIDHR